MNKQNILPLSRVSIFIVICILYSACANSPSKTQQEEKQTSEPTMKKAQLRHVVMFKFKEDASQEGIEKVEKAFADLQNKIPQIKDFEWGTNNSPEGLDKGFTHCFFVTFDSEEDRAAYLPHPDHKAFVDVLKPVMEDAMVLDYWTK